MPSSIPILFTPVVYLLSIGFAYCFSITSNSANRFSNCFQETSGMNLQAKASAMENINDVNRTVTILGRGPNHIVALKPPSVVCHHSGWTGSRSRRKGTKTDEIPMLQRVRDAIHDIDSRNMDASGSKEIIEKRKVNLIHRLDRGASGLLLLSYADSKNNDNDSATANLIEAMSSQESNKTYVALVRGEGILHGEDFKEKGWFEVSRPIKDENGIEKNATTFFNFVAGQPESYEDGLDRPRMSLVLARPKQGRWHQIRRHLNGLSHPILGDSTHGVSKINREWKEKRNLPGERICLHLARLQLPPSEAVPEGIDISCPVLDDMLSMLKVYAPNVLKESLGVLEKEGIILESEEQYEVGKYIVPDNKENFVHILQKSEHYVVAEKPPSVVVHHSDWTSEYRREPTPMLQRVRDKTNRRVNPIHRLDRGASGCLLFSFSQKRGHKDADEKPCSITKTLIGSMQNPRAIKTYFALCDGDGIWNGINYLKKGWFTTNQPVKDEFGNWKEGCRTDICFIASKLIPEVEDSEDNLTNLEGRKVSIILARPHTGKWHQIRQHLSSRAIGHPIIGDSSHGRSRTNRIWKKKRYLMKERTCLHLSRIQLPATEYTPNGIDVSCPLPSDLKRMLQEYPDLMSEAEDVLLKEGVKI